MMRRKNQETKQKHKLIFARNDAGQKLLNRAYERGYIYLGDYTEMENLKYIQLNYFNMQTTMIGKIVGLKMRGQSSSAIQY